ncbi:hypothetical protein M8J75_011287 [Diaphorina citri]|nr:hypothetical protein M8J75_011287 [Diaphorina citri]
MSKKRTAESDLNHENWANEEEPEEPGRFMAASEEQMSQRRVIRAVRRNPNKTNASESLFSNFKGFSSTPTLTPSPGTFDFLKMLNKPSSDSSAKTNNSTSPSSTRTAPPPDLISSKPVNPFANILGNKNPLLQKPSMSKPEESSSSTTTSSANTSTTTSSMSNTTTLTSSAPKTKRIKCDENEKKSDGTAKSSESEEKSEAQQQFEEKVRQLNVKFVHFIHDRIKANPYVLLLPPLDDYRKYIEKFIKEKLETENGKKLEKEGYNFNIPSRGATAQVTLQNNISGETKTFPIGGGFGLNATESKDAGKSFSFSNAPSKTTSSTASSLSNSFTTTSKPATNGTKPVEVSFAAKSESAAKPEFSFAKSEQSSAVSPSAKPSFSFGLTKPDQNGETPKPASGFNWGSPKSADSKTESKAPGFSLGQGKDTPKLFGQGDPKPSVGFSWGKTDNTKDESSTGTTKLPSFSFGTSSAASTGVTNTDTSSVGAAKPFSFGFANAPPPVAPVTEDDDEPLPKEPVKEIVEEDSVFNIKAKIFVMKPDKSYGERGVGNLFVKPVEEGVKAQVIVRTETDTGKIIFNVVVTKEVPIRREKNNLILVTIPHPTVDKAAAPVPCLIRVKTQEDAEKLLKCLEKFQG